jgi:hypothetical protein
LEPLGEGDEVLRLALVRETGTFVTVGVRVSTIGVGTGERDDEVGYNVELYRKYVGVAVPPTPTRATGAFVTVGGRVPELPLIVAALGDGDAVNMDVPLADCILKSTSNEPLPPPW